MPNYTIQFSGSDFSPSATLVVKLRDQANTFGVRKIAGDVIVAAGTAMVEGDGRQYSYGLTDLDPGDYEYVVEVELLELDQTEYVQGSFAVLPIDLPTYLTVPEALQLASSLTDLPVTFTELLTSQQLMLLGMATMRLDQIFWQGQKYEEDQELQFPRFDNSRGWTLARGWGKPVELSEITVPNAIKLACLYEAASLADGKRREITDAIANGLASQSVGKRSESYRPLSTNGVVTLCSQAEDLIQKFRLRTGRMV